MILDDPVARSSYGPRQAQGAANNIETKRPNSPSSRNGWTSGPADAAPEFVLYSVRDLLNRAVQRGVFPSRDGSGSKSLTRDFQAGTLTMEAFDLRNADNRFGNEGLSCFAFSVVRNE